MEQVAYAGSVQTRTKKALPADIEIGKRMRAYRVLRKMSQTDLGTAVGVTFQQIQKYEKGVNRVGGGRLQLIGNALGVTVSDLMGTANHTIPIEHLELVRDHRVVALLGECFKMKGDKRRRALFAVYALFKVFNES